MRQDARQPVFIPTVYQKQPNLQQPVAPLGLEEIVFPTFYTPIAPLGLCWFIGATAYGVCLLLFELCLDPFDDIFFYEGLL